MLLMLIEAVVNAGFQLIQSNTDGIFVKVDSSRFEEYLTICSE